MCNVGIVIHSSRVGFNIVAFVHSWLKWQNKLPLVDFYVQESNLWFSPVGPLFSLIPAELCMSCMSCHVLIHPDHTCVLLMILFEC